MTISCPICESTTPESQERLKEVARIGLARFLHIASKAQVTVTDEQKRDIYATLLRWENAGEPCEVDWLIHEHAIRAVYSCVFSDEDETKLIAASASIPAWNANSGIRLPWNCEYERFKADSLKPILRDDPE